MGKSDRKIDECEQSKVCCLPPQEVMKNKQMENEFLQKENHRLSQHRETLIDKLTEEHNRLVESNRECEKLNQKLQLEYENEFCFRNKLHNIVDDKTMSNTNKIKAIDELLHTL